MLTEYGVIKPDVPRAGLAGQEEHEHWRREWQEKYPDWKPLGPEWNIRFAHDPAWREAFFSVQCVIDSQNNFDPTKPAHWFWLAVWGGMLAADLAWYGLRAW